jgi:hypothetical protein
LVDVFGFWLGVCIDIPTTLYPNHPVSAWTVHEDIPYAL